VGDSDAQTSEKPLAPPLIGWVIAQPITNAGDGEIWVQRKHRLSRAPSFFKPIEIGQRRG
jgi:hypothetical protein